MRCLLVLAVAAIAVGGCEVSGPQSRRMVVSQESARILKSLNARLRAGRAEVSFRCRNSFWSSTSASCQIDIDGSRTPRLNVEAIPHPFEDRIMVVRLKEGTQSFQRSLYEGLGAFVPTRDFQGRLDERTLELEQNKLKFRCVATRDSVPRYSCWTLIAAELLN